jgi:hypothetical protein
VDHIARSEVEANVRNEDEFNQHFEPKDAGPSDWIVGKANPAQMPKKKKETTTQHELIGRRRKYFNKRDTFRARVI